MKEIRWTETGKRTLRETSDFLLELWNDKVNQDFIDQLEFRIGQLSRNPEMGPALDNTDFRKLVIHQTISLYYVNRPDFIKVLVIWDNRSNPDQLLEKLTDANNQ